jgi:putative ABC transport system permease protein
MISLSFAIFSASMAKTLDRWMSDFQYYRSGADLVVREYELSGGGGSQISAPSPDSQSTNSIQMVESMISLEHHLKLPSIQSATYSGKWDGHFSYGAEPQECTVMGIDRLTFPTTGFYRRDFAAQSLGVLMNALAAQPFGVLIPEGLALESGLQPGDRLHIETSIGVGEELFSADMIVVGLYRYFPTVVSFEKPTLIASLESLFGSPDVVTGVDVWLNLRPGAQIGSTDSFNQFADLPEDSVLGGLRRLAAHDWLQVEVRGNALNEVEKGLRQPEWVGLFGVLNVGFLLTGLLPAIGFVLYSFAALHKRLIQFGILQALGLSTRQAAASLLLEQVLLMSVALTGGAGVGFLTSSLFLPFLQVGQAGAAPVPPFVISVGWGEAAWLCAAFGLLFLLTLAGMMASLASTKIFQAVKMGESV